MSLRTSLFLALRYLQPRRSFMTISMALSILGPVIGVAVLIVVISVMNGFHDKFRGKIFSLISHLRVTNFGAPIKDPGKLVARLTALGFKATPVVAGSVMVQANRQLRPVSVMGIDQQTDREVTEIRAHCVYRAKNPITDQVEREYDFRSQYDRLQDHECLLGVSLLQALGLQVGDKIVVHPASRLKEYIRYRDDGSLEVVEPAEKYLPEELLVVGVFQFGMPQFDGTIIVTTLDKASELVTMEHPDAVDRRLEWGDATEIKVKTPDPFRFAAYEQQLRHDPLLGLYHCVSWRHDELGFFDALQTEKVTMFVLLVLIVVVSAFCVCATLITVVFQKTREIGVLKALGGNPPTIMLIFVVQGAVIGAVGVVAGTLLGLLLLWIRNDFLRLMSDLFGRNLLPPLLYFFDGLPATVRVQDIATVIVSAFVLCVLAAVVPALMATAIPPGRAIRAE